MDIQDLAVMLTEIATVKANEHTVIPLHGMTAVIARFGNAVGYAHGNHLVVETFPDVTTATVEYLNGVTAFRHHQAQHLREHIAQHRPLADLVGQPVPDYPPAG